MSTLKTNNVQVGQSVTATNNFTWYQPASPDGTVRLGVGNSGATTADVITATSAGNVLVGGTTLQGATGYVGSRTNARVWADFNETTINASHNVSSITVNSSGVYTVNFANALNSSFYAPLVNNRKANDLNDVVGWVNRINNSYTQSTTAFQFASMFSSGSYSPARQYMVIFCN